MYKIDNSLKQKIDSLPLLPGCYIYKDKDENIIYVGKAIRLRDRVKSYFLNYERLDPKTQLLIETIHDFEYLVVDTEAEALILETNLIKKYKPHFNRAMMDDKNYSFIKINTKEDFPKIQIVRKYVEDGSEYFGPYLQTFPTKEVLKRLRKVFPYRSCNRKIKEVKIDPNIKHRNNINPYRSNGSLGVDSSDPKPCLYFHLHLCSAPCRAYIERLEYRKNINNIRRFLRGEKSEILKEIEDQMKQASKEFKFERASVLRDRIQSIKYVLNQVRIGSNVDDVSVSIKKRLEKENALNELFTALELKETYTKLKKDDKEIKIECYDISNIQGTNPVGSMVVFVNGTARNDLYRKFKINRLKTPNDYLMHQEMMERRINKYLKSKDKDESNKYTADESFDTLPALMIIDGGKGQLSSIHEILVKYNLTNIPHIGLAKREEEIFYLKDGEFIRVKLPKKSEALFLIQRIRDETHRFGITYHRKLRSKKFLNPDL